MAAFRQILESLRETQEEEFEALKAIYEGQVEDLRKKDAWKVMIMDLCQMIEEFLHEKNQKISRLSFYEEMVQTREAKKRQESTDEEKMRQVEAAEIEAEIQRRKDEAILNRNSKTPNRQISEQDSLANRIDQRESADLGRSRSLSLPPKSENHLSKSAKDAQKNYANSPEAPETLSEEETEPFFPSDALSSRLLTEFSVLKVLGKGGFGEVIKVRNRLDDQVYAIKRIALNPECKQLNKKIKREVKLLSRLNHENVVRYFNSWIEERKMETEGPSSQADAQSSSAESDEKDGRRVVTAGETPAEGCSFAEWSVSYSTPNDQQRIGAGRFFRNSGDDESSSESDEENEGILGPSYFYQDEKAKATEQSVMFLETSDKGARKFSKSSTLEIASSIGDAETVCVKDSWGQGKYGNLENTGSRQILYIQMEFCEKNTLRQAIDNGELLTESRRGWRLFREILEGLNHIHSQAGMIHRDIKPGNIFLDAQYHVKIGDFGLATAGRVEEIRDEDLPNLTIGSSQSTGLTTKIGTALYAAPELLSESAYPQNYSQKVDVYSTGVVLFEMFYRPLPLGMERIKIISDLRETGVVIPRDFGEELSVENKQRVVKIVKWMLSHKPEIRPSLEEILKSEHLPPLEMQETEFQKAFQNALASGAQSRSYKWIFGQIFEENRFPNNAQDFCFDKDLYTFQKEDFSRDLRKFIVAQEVETRLTKIFRRHGAVRLCAPFFIPKNRQLSESTVVTKTWQKKPVEVIDKSGMVLNLPYDSKFGFARFIVKNQITRLKRFSFEKVFRDEGMGTHPREATDCSIDIVTSDQTCSTAAAELLAILEEIIAEFSALRDKKLILKLNHSNLIRGICHHTGITSTAKQDQLMELLEEESKAAGPAAKSEQMSGSQAMQIKNKKYAALLGISEQTAATVMSFLETEDSLGKIGNQLKSVLRKKNSELGAQLAKEALELEKIRLSCENLGLSLEPVISLSTVRRPNQYNGLMFQLSCELEKESRKKAKSLQKEWAILAAGGRYDGLVESFRKPAIEPAPPTCVAAVGASIVFNKLAALVLEQRKKENLVGYGDQVPVEVLVCSVGQKNLLREKLGLLKELWGNELGADYLQEPVGSLEDLQDHCRAIGIRNLVVFKDTEPVPGVVLLKSCDATGKFGDRKMARAELVNSILGWRNDLVLEAQKSTENVSGNYPLVKTASVQDMSVKEGRTESFISSQPVSYLGCATLANLKITFLEKIVDRNSRKRLVQEIESQVSQLVQKFSAKVSIELIATDLPGMVLKSFHGGLDWGSEAAYRKSAGASVAQWNKYKKPLAMLVENLGDLLFGSGPDKVDKSGEILEDNKAIVILSYEDKIYRVILP